MITLRENREAFSRMRIMPRCLIDVTNISVETTILGDKIASPICVAPSAMQKMAHHDGECATAKAAARMNTLMTLSSWSTIPLEEVAQSAPGGLRWFQLYVYKDRKVTMDLVKRAERAGYKAFAVTVDTPQLGRREADIRNRFSLPAHLTMGNFVSTGGAHASGTKSAGDKGSGLASYVASLIDQTLTWNDIAWLRKNTTMKIVVKGVMTVEDALLSVRHGVDGIWVSNHGARQLDTAPATIEVLPDICRAVAGRVEVYLDGGVTRGTDVMKGGQMEIARRTDCHAVRTRASEGSSFAPHVDLPLASPPPISLLTYTPSFLRPYHPLLSLHPSTTYPQSYHYPPPPTLHLSISTHHHPLPPPPPRQPWLWAPRPSSWAAPCCGASRTAARRACTTC